MVGKAILLQVKRLRLPISRELAYEGGKVVSLTQRLPLPPKR